MTRWWASAAVLGLAFGARAGGDGAGSLSGRLLDERTAAPVAGQVIVLPEESEDERLRRSARGGAPAEAARVSSGAYGTFQLVLPEGDGSYRVEAVAEGHARVVVIEGVDGRARAAVGDVRLPAGGALEGQVLGPDGKPAGGALVTLDRRSPWGAFGATRLPSLSTMTGADGRFRLDGVAKDGGRLVVLGAGLAPRVVEVAGARSGLVVKMAAGQPLSGALLEEATGKAVGGGFVEATGDGWGCVAQVDPSGTFRFDDLAAGAVTVRSCGASHAPAVWKGSVPRRPEDPPIVLKVAPAGRLEIVAVAQDGGALIARARVGYRVAGAATESVAFADARGRAAISGVSSGTTLTATLRARGFREAQSGTLRVPPEGTRRVRVALLRAASLEGEVVNPEGKPVAGAAVTLRVDAGRRVVARWGEGPWRAATDARGHFRIDDVPAEVLRITLAHPELARREIPLPRLAPGEARRGMRVVMEPGARVAGRVVDDAGKPVAGASVRIEPAEQRVFPSDPDAVLARGACGADGRFALGGLAAGDAMLVPEAPGFVAGDPVPIAIASGKEAQAGDVVLRRAGTLRGQVLDAAKQPVAGAAVSVSSGAPRFGSAPPSFTDGDGRFEVRDVDPAAELSVSASAKGKGACTRRGIRATGDAVELVLERRPTVSGRVVVKGEDRPVTAFSVGWKKSVAGGAGGQSMAMIMGGRTESFQAEDGSFRLQDLQPGRLELIVRAPGFVESRLDGVEASLDAEAPPVVIELARGRRIGGRVVDGAAPDRPPIPGALVTVAEEEAATGMNVGLGGEPLVLTDGDGAFVLEGVAPGLRIVKAEAERRPAVTKEVAVEGDVDGVVIALGRGATVRGEVRRRDGSAAANARVELGHEGPSDLSFEVADASGAFAFEGVAPGAYVLRAEMPSRAGSPRAPVVVADGDPAPVALRIHDGVRVSGTVKGLLREVLEKVRVEAYAEGTHASAMVGVDGGFALGNLLPGRLEVTAVDQAGGRTVSRALVIDEEAVEAIVDLEFPEGARVTGKVTKSGKPLGGVRVMAGSREGAARVDGGGVTGADGAFALEGLPDGTYDFALMAFEPMLRYEAELVVKGNTTFDVEIPVSVVDVLVRDGKRREPIASAHVTLAAAASETLWTARTTDTDATGRAKFAEIPDGEFVISARADGFAAATARAWVAQGEVKGGVTIDLLAEGVVALKVLDARTGAAPASIAVTRVEGEAAVSRTEVPGVDGAFRVRGLAAGAVFLVVEPPGAAPLTLPAVTAPGEVKLTASGGGRIAILLPDGAAGTVRLQRPDGATEWLPGNVGVHREAAIAPPRAVVGPVVAGGYQLVLTVGGAPAVHAVTVREGETATVDVR